jgi:hypothetical protein
MLVGDEFGGVEALTSRVSYASDCPWVVNVVFFGKIIVGLTDIDAVPLSGGTIPSWWASWLPFSISLYVSKEDLGPASSGCSVSLPS